MRSKHRKRHRKLALRTVVPPQKLSTTTAVMPPQNQKKKLPRALLALVRLRRVAWAPCGTLLAATSFDATCCVWRRSRQDDAWEILATLEGHENEVKGP